MFIIINILSSTVLSVLYMYLLVELVNKKYNFKNIKILLIQLILFILIFQLISNNYLYFILLYLFLNFLYLFSQILSIKLLKINLLLIAILIILNYILIILSNNLTLLWINIVLLMGYLLLIHKYLVVKDSFDNINDRYFTILNSFNKYEEMIDKYRILNHENKNQLLTIRAMITKSDKNIPDYIDSLINTTIKDNEKLMFETNVIPSGGLRAIIYSKMLCMQDKGIKPILEVERSIRKIDLSCINDELLIDICKIIGVFLDNAIEEVEKLDKKEIKIKLFLNNDNLCINIKNKFLQSFNINKIDNCGYTTKGKGHGYGLALVKNIVSENSNKLVNNKIIENSYFIQNLEIIDIK